jgi:TonB-linked SusC/RagA family outer membrane protein
MKSRFTGILTLFLAFFIQFSFAQEKTVTGNVVSEQDGLGLPGVNVTVQGTTRGVQTGLDGEFSITVTEGEKLSFSFTGMTTQVITVGSGSVINVTMKEDNILDVVSVEGYRTTSKPLSNVAAVTVTAKTIEGRPNASFIQTLQGQVPGLNISTGSGQPGANSTVILRGYGSINGNVEPLYVIDGVPLTVDNFRSLNPNDIESVSVLKDAGATAIYGNRGANGVIIVTTKKGDFATDLQIRYNSMFGFNTLQNNDYNVMNAQQILTLEKSVGAPYASSLTDDEIANYAFSTDWKDVLFRTGTSQSHVLSLTSGGKNTTSYTSLGYYNIEGVLENTALNRFNFRNNTSGRTSDGKFTYNTSFTANFSKNNEIWGAGSGNVNLNPLLGAMQGLPYISPSWYENGPQLHAMYTGANNPYGVGTGNLALTPLMLMDQFRTFVYDTNEIKSIANLQAAYKITDDLTLGTSFGADFTETQFLLHRSPDNFTELLFQAANEEYLGYQTENTIRNILMNSTTRLNYNKNFAEKHTIDVSAFIEYFKAHAKGMQYTQNGLDPRLTSPGAGTGFIPHNPQSNPQLYVPQVGASKATAGLFSYFATADYDYNKRYGVAASIRRDASFRFATTNRWGTFWSVAGRWNIDQEDFMADSGFQMLKLRASYGTSGNQNISGQSVFNAANLTRSLYQSVAGYANNSSYILTQLANDDLRWETIAQLNIGVDFQTLSSRLRGSLDVYRKLTTDMFVETPLSAITGFPVIDANVAEMENRGIEAILHYDVFPSDSEFQLTLTANGSYNKNKIIDIASETGRVPAAYQVYENGHPMLEYYVVKYAGVNPANGNALFYTADGELTETPDEDLDRVHTGKTFFPIYQGGFGFNAEYKNFFLTTQFNFVADIWRFDWDYESLVATGAGEFGQFNKSADLTRAWTPDNRYTDIPALTYSTANYDVHDRFLKDASYLRLRFVSFGYDFSKELLKGTFIDGLRVYAQGENLVTWSKWRGWDAESNRASDYSQYPTPRTIAFGLDLQF